MTAKFGWSFTDYSFLAGQQYRYKIGPLWSFEFQYDRYRSSCLTQKRYLGLGANYSFNGAYNEWGLKCMWNPTRLIIMTSRTIKFYPYIFGQGNYIVSKNYDNNTAETNLVSSYGFRPGLGLTGKIREDHALSIRTYLQVGYNIPFDSDQNFKKSISVEFKVGFALNSRKMKRNKQSIEESEQAEIE